MRSGCAKPPAPDAATGVTWFAPMRAEARAVRAGLSAYPDQRVVRTGTGPRRAMRTVRCVPDVRDGVLVVAGIAGGLDPVLRTGDVVVADRVRYAGTRGESGFGPIDLPAAQAISEALTAGGIQARTGGLVTVDSPVLAAHRRGGGMDGALAVDLESAWLLTVPARLHCVVRVVADPAGRPLLHPSTLSAVRAALRSLTGLVRALAPVLQAPATVDPKHTPLQHQEVDTS